MISPRLYTVMTVCTGNICRSPMGEIVLRAYVHERGLDGKIRVISSGISNEEQGHSIDSRAIKALTRRGYSIPPSHYAHKITPSEMKETRLLLPMTASHARSLRYLMSTDGDHLIRMYRSFVPELSQMAGDNYDRMDLADPWYGGPHDFELALDQIEEAAPYILDFIEKDCEQ